MSTAHANDQTYMAGSENTGEYFVIAWSSLGRIGGRSLQNGTVRVRVEPTSVGTSVLSEHFLPEEGWKQPGDNDQARFSKVVLADETGIATIEAAIKALAAHGDLQRNNAQRLWRKHFRITVA